MNLTRRGWIVLVIVLLAMTLSYIFSPRALNAVAAPLIAALGLGAIVLRRAPAATVEESGLYPGYPGSVRTRHLEMGGGGLARIRQERPAGLGGSAVEQTVALPAGVDVRVPFDARGRYELPAPAVAQRDPLGLLSREVEAADPTEVLVYPHVYDLAGDRRLGPLFADEFSAERQEFDRLREYVPGDPLRNVHWKSSAKHDDYLVMEFAPSKRTKEVTIAADAAAVDGDAVAGVTRPVDEMASAAASLVVLGLAQGMNVGLRLPDDVLEPDNGAAQRRTALRRLAASGPGRLQPDAHEAAQVSIRSDADGTKLYIEDRSLSFADLVAGRDPVDTLAEVHS